MGINFRVGGTFILGAVTYYPEDIYDERLDNKSIYSIIHLHFMFRKIWMDILW